MICWEIVWIVWIVIDVELVARTTCRVIWNTYRYEGITALTLIIYNYRTKTVDYAVCFEFVPELLLIARILNTIMPAFDVLILIEKSI